MAAVCSAAELRRVFRGRRRCAGSRIVHLPLAEMMDGKLLVATNVQDLEPGAAIERYKSLANIERGFKVLKSELEVGPVYHRLQEHIQTEASICFIALILH